MKFSRVKVSAGRPDELNNDGAGYAANGESAFTRAAAHGRELRGRLPSAKTSRRVSKGKKLPLPELIAETQQGVQWIEAQMRIEDDPTRKAKLAINLEIKSRRLSELRRALNLGAGHADR